MEDDLDLNFDEQNDNTEETAKTVDPKKLEKIERERKALLNRVISGNIENLQDKVTYVLNNFDAARNSDADMLWLYWQTFDYDKFKGSISSSQELKSLTKPASIVRERAKIQNVYNLFKANERVRRFRKTLEGDKRDEAINDKPAGIGQYSVYIDETGKTQDYLSVASLWVLKYQMSQIETLTTLQKWKKEKQIDYEFHFSELSKHKVNSFKDFFTKFLGLNPEAGFKIIVLNNKGLADKAAALTDLTCHLILKGIEHENSSGRATLPRVLQVWIDEDEQGSDQLKIENIKERIKGQKIPSLYLGDMSAVESKGNFNIQAIDLFAGAVNRKLHYPEGGNFKDSFADFVLDSIGFDISSIDKSNQQVDNAQVFDLTRNQQLLF
ncbi:MAG: hypothetical protein JWQ96_3318 [Segetibacter sp.]|nr:hypothetical protein [Segetibacter sp.]